MSDSRDEVLFEVQERIAELRRAGRTIDVAGLAAEFAIDEAEVEACLRAAQWLGDVLDTTPKPPDLPEEFELVGELGRGGMGVVYRVHQKPLGRDLALKVLRTAELDDARSLARFEREARALARLRHPNIVGVHSVGRSGNAVYYTMDLIEGRDLAETLRKGPMKIDRAVHLARQVADAVAHAHRQNILHRDLKPGNVLMDSDGNAHVVDFGLARDLSTDRSRQTATGQLLGTPGSMSPEQARGDLEALGPATDVHGLGALLYEMLVGHPPFRADSLHELLRAVVETDPPRADAVRRKVPRDLATICEHAMARDIDARYPSAEAFGDDLRRFAEGEPIAAQPLGLASRAGRRLLRERRLVVIALFAVALIATAFFVGSRLDRGDHTRELVAALRARGEAVAALTLLEGAGAETGSVTEQRRLTHALLDAAEQNIRDPKAGEWLSRAAKLIEPNYRITRFGGGTGGGGRGYFQRLAPYRDEDFEEIREDNRDAPPWSVLAMRHAFLDGDLERVAIQFNQLGLVGPDSDEVLDWFAAAREDENDLGHASALGVCLVLCMPHPHESDLPWQFDESDAPRHLWADLVQVRDRLPTSVTKALDAGVRSIEAHWNSPLSPSEILAIPLAIAANSPTATSEKGGNLAALVAAAMGCPPLIGPGQQPIAVQRTLQHWNTWKAADAARRVQLRGDLAALLWGRMPTDFEEEKRTAEWFQLATGCPHATRAEALEWWQEHREDDPRKLLTIEGAAGPNDLLDLLGSTTGAKIRRLHDLLTLYAGDRAVPWPGGGPAARGTVGDPRRAGLINAWSRAFDRAPSSELRLRFAILSFQDGATRPSVVARHQITGRVGDEIEIRRELENVLHEPGTHAYVRGARAGVFGIARSDIRFALVSDVTFLPDPRGAVALIEDESWTRTGESHWGTTNRSDRIPVRIATGEVGAVMTLATGWRITSERTNELVLMATLEDASAPDSPWSAHTWSTGVERTLLATAPDQAPPRHAVRAATHLPLPATRDVLARAKPIELPDEEDSDFEGDQWQARLLAGVEDLPIDERRVRGIGDRWHGAATWGRLLRTTPSDAIRAQARELLARIEKPGGAISRTLLTTLPENEIDADLRQRLEASLESSWMSIVRSTAFVLLHLGWLFLAWRFLRTEARSEVREQARNAMLMLMGLVLMNSVVIGSVLWPIPWLWFAIHAWLYRLGQSEREQKSKVVAFVGRVLIFLAVVMFADSSGLWRLSEMAVALIPPSTMFLAAVGMIWMASVQKRDDPPWRRRQA